MKKSSLAEGLKAAANKPLVMPTPKNKAGTVLIGGNFEPEVRSALLLVKAEPENARKTVKDLLGEAINDLCAKYGKPQPYSGEA
jgi:hypothetical protein